MTDTDKNEATILLWMIDTLGAAGWRVIFNRDDARAWIEIRRERMIHGMPRPAAGRDSVPATIAALRELARLAGVKLYQSEARPTLAADADAFATAPRTWALRWTVREYADGAQWEAWSDLGATTGPLEHREIVARGCRPAWNGERWTRAGYPAAPPAGGMTPGELRSMGHIGPPDGRLRRP